MVAKQLLLQSSAKTFFGCKIASMKHAQCGWQLFDDHGDERGVFDALLITAPAPQTQDILQTAASSDISLQVMCDRLRSVNYNKTISLIFGLTSPIERIDLPSKISFAADSSVQAVVFSCGTKSDHIVCHMSPEWSEENWDSSENSFENMWPSIQRLISKTLAIDLPGYLWTDMQKWRYATPKQLMRREDTCSGESMGLFVCGDFLAVGTERCSLEAMRTGERISAFLQSMQLNPLNNGHVVAPSL
jgi:renalase